MSKKFAEATKSDNDNGCQLFSTIPDADKLARQSSDIFIMTTSDCSDELSMHGSFEHFKSQHTAEQGLSGDFVFVGRTHYACPDELLPSVTALFS